MFKLSPLLSLSLSASLLMVGVGMIVPLVPQKIFALCGSMAGVGLTASAFALAYLPTLLPAGALSDRYGAKRFVVLGFLLCGLSGIVLFFARSASEVYLGRMIQGMGEAPVWALGPAILALCYRESKGRAIGFYNAAIHAALTVGPLAGLLVARTGGADLPFLIFAALCLIGGAIVALSLRRGIRAVPTDRSETSLAALAALVGRPRPVLIFCGVLLYGAGYGVFISVLPVYLTMANGFGETLVSLHFVVFYGSVSVAQALAGRFSDMFGRNVFIVAGLGLAAAGWSGSLITPGSWVFIPLAVASLGLGAFCVASLAELADSVPDGLKGTISGGYYLFWAGGFILGPLLTGLLATRAPEAGFLSLAAALAVIAAALAIRRR